METQEYKGLTFEVGCDEHWEPEEEHLGTFITKSGRYTLGWETKPDERSIEAQIKEDLDLPKKKALQDCVGHNSGGILLPVYAYIHGNTALSFHPFSCPWDSGMCGWYYVTKKEARDWFVLKPRQKIDWDRVQEVMQTLLDFRQAEINGEVYQYNVYDVDGELLDGGSGFSSSDDAEKEAKEFINQIEP